MINNALYNSISNDLHYCIYISDKKKKQKTIRFNPQILIPFYSTTHRSQSRYYTVPEGISRIHWTGVGRGRIKGYNNWLPRSSDHPPTTPNASVRNICLPKLFVSCASLHRFTTRITAFPASLVETNMTAVCWLSATSTSAASISSSIGGLMMSTGECHTHTWF